MMACADEVVCFILHQGDVDETESQRDSDISSSDAGTFEVVALKCERFSVAYGKHSLNGPGFLASAPTDVETHTCRAPFDFDNKDPAPNGLITV